MKINKNFDISNYALDVKQVSINFFKTLNLKLIKSR